MDGLWFLHTSVQVGGQVIITGSDEFLGVEVHFVRWM